MNSKSKTNLIENNVTRLIAEAAHRWPQKTALVCPSQASRGEQDQTISFEDLWQTTGTIAASLRQRGLQPGDRVIIMIPMSIDLYLCLLAVVQMGAVAVFVDPWISTQQIARFADFAKPCGFIGIGKSHLLRVFRSRLRRMKLTVTSGWRLFGIPARYRLADLKQSENQNAESQSAIEGVGLDHPALITFTSGSGGDPKGANRTHRFLTAQHEALKSEFPYQDDDVDMPMFPVFALNNLVTGITSIVPKMDFRKVADVDGEAIVQQMTRHQVTTCTASPPFLDRVSAALMHSNANLKLRRILTGGAPVRNQQLVDWTETFEESEIIVAYGSTEAEPVGHIEAQQRVASRSEQGGYCTGKPTPLVQTKIIPIQKGSIEGDPQSLPSGSIGELVVCGDHVCRDYFENDRATRENKIIDPDGRIWHRMGDTGYFDRDGNFWLVGRVHSTIERTGKLIHPQIVEQIVRQTDPLIHETASLGIDDTQLGQKHVLLVGIQDNQRTDLEPVIRSSLTEKEIPVDQVVLTTTRMPLDPRHHSKIDYGQTRQMFLDNKF